MSDEKNKRDNANPSGANNQGFSRDELAIVYKKMWNESLSDSGAFGHGHEVRDIFIDQNSANEEIDRRIQRVTSTKIPLLILGPTGAGKTQVARNIHYSSGRKSKPFVKVSCGNLTEELLHSELFGHVKGAYTGAIDNRMGLFEAADGGTILLDEIDEISLHMQSKLLRVSEDGIINRLGSNKPIPVDVRIIAATNAALTELVKQKKFREDLYYRLRGFEITVPPLRDRHSEILPLARYFIARFAYEQNKLEIEGMSDKCKQTLFRYDWPGNIRELQRRMETAVALSTKYLIAWNDVFWDLATPPNIITSADSRRLAILEEYAGPKAIDNTNLTIELLDQLAEEGQPLTSPKLAATLRVGPKQGQRRYYAIKNALASIQWVDTSITSSAVNQ